jgi:hypothetical protein
VQIGKETMPRKNRETTGLTGRLDLKGLAARIAPLCRMLRQDVMDALKDPASPSARLVKEWRQPLIPDASDEQLADAYAQTFTLALVLGRSDGADPLTPAAAEAALSARHSLLSRALHVLTDPPARAGMAGSLDPLLRAIADLPPATLAGSEDPWLHFYEEFLAAYDPKLRKDAGAYYTPIEVVRAQVRLIDDALVNWLGKPLGFADRGVVTLDPAAGTGTYLLAVIDHALNRVEAEHGAGAVPAHATALAANLYGFELMAGPCAVAERRTSRALCDLGAMLPQDGPHIHLADALSVKKEVPVTVCLGNPPYDRHAAGNRANRSRAGGWVRKGEDGTAIFRRFLEPAIAAGHGVRVHNLYNLYIYFWRWALWKVFEQESARGPGVVSFVSASSYFDGDAFCGMREHMRRLCDEIWILDLGGEERGPRKDENVFAIQTPVAIAVAIRSGKTETKQPAKVHYSRVEGTRAQKLSALGGIAGLSSVEWQECPTEWPAPFRPAGKGRYFDWPLLTDLLPWQHSGVKAGRTWVISPEVDLLRRRWRTLLGAKPAKRRALFKDSPTGRKAHQAALPLDPDQAQEPDIVRFAYRSFDRQFIFADARLLDRPGPALRRARGAPQVFLASLFSQALGNGPALTSCAAIPDLDYFRGSYGAKAAIPLYRDAESGEANILPGLLDLLSQTYHHAVTPEDFLAYVYGTLAQPAFTASYAKELETRELRVPITKDAALFGGVRQAGARLLWLHTYGERFVPGGERCGHIPRGAARCVKPVPGGSEGYPESFGYHAAGRTLRVGDGSFRPVSPEVFEFEVSGLKVLRSWLKHRLREGAGKTSSPLDKIRPERWTGAYTTELLELLWLLEATVESYPEQARLLEAVVAGPAFSAGDLPPVPDAARKPPVQLHSSSPAVRSR